MLEQNQIQAFDIDATRVVWKKQDQETVVLNAATGSYYVLNELGGCIWDLARSGKNRLEITSAVRAFYSAMNVEADEETERFLDNLLSEDLLAAKAQNEEVVSDSVTAFPPTYIKPCMQKYGDILEWGFGSTGINA
jgi:hypothetical protein